MYACEMIRIQLTSRQEDNQCSEGILIVPPETGVKELDDLLEHMCGKRGFTYRIQQKVLRQCIRDTICNLGISNEDIVTIEYEETSPLPKACQTISEPDWIRCLAIGRERGKILSGSFDRCIRLYTTLDGEPITFKGLFDTVTALLWLDEERFVAGGADGSIFVWHCNHTLWPVCRLRCGSGAPIQSMCLFKYHIYIAHYDGSVCKFSLSSIPSTIEMKQETCVSSKKRDKTPPIASVNHSGEFPSNNIAIASLLSNTSYWYKFSWDGSIQQYNHDDLVLYSKCTAPISCASLLDESIYLTGHSNGTVRVWKDHELVNTFHAHNGWVSSITVIDGNTFVTTGYDGVVKAWDRNDLESPTAILYEPSKSSTKVLCSCFDDGAEAMLVVGGESKTLQAFKF